jgi:hypothetical protein
VIGSTTVFRLPHAAPHVCDSGATQGITNDSFDSTTFWIGSKAMPSGMEVAEYLRQAAYLTMVLDALRAELKDKNENPRDGAGA